MRRQISIVCLLAASVLGTGAQWDLLQVFAWGRMIVGHSQTMPLTAAVAKAFDGETCPICRLVAKAQKQDQTRSNVPDTQVEAKLLLFFQPAALVVVNARPLLAWRTSDSPAFSEFRFAPPVPPPRQAEA